MPIAGCAEYKSREFCNAVRCPTQMELNTKQKGSKEYEEIRQLCKNACRYTAWQFHHWLMDRGYLILKQGGK